MICPNCGEEMKPIDRRYFGFGDEPDYDLCEHIGDECRKCRIKHDERSHSWILPDSLKPTEKQIKTSLFIANRLFVRTDNLVTKKQYCEFIGKYFDEAKSKVVQDDYFDDGNYDFEDFQ